MDDSSLDDFLGRMDHEYRAQFSLAAISQHAQLVNRLSGEQPVALSIVPEESELFTVTVVAFDYFAALSTITGILTSFGFDIQDAKAYTCKDQRKTTRDHGARRKGVSHNKAQIVDVFLAQYQGEVPINTTFQEHIEGALISAFQLLDQDRLYEARGAVNRRLAEGLSKMPRASLDLIARIEVTFDNTRSERWTVVNVYSKNSFAFLYAMSNALSLRGIYIHGMKTHSRGNKVHDTFLISDRQGARLEDEDKQRMVRSATTLIKRFTQYLPSAPDPAKAMEYFDRFLDKLLDQETPDQTLTLLSLTKKDNLGFLARLFGASDFLWEGFLRTRFDMLLPVLEDFHHTGRARSKSELELELAEWLTPLETFEQRRDTLNLWKDRETFRIGVRHLLEPQGGLSRFSSLLSNLAEVLLDRAYIECHAALTATHGTPCRETGEPCAFTICGLGKFGGRELGYASDLEVLFLYEGEGAATGTEPLDNAEYFDQLAESIMDFIRSRPEGIFHFDTRLRPFGSGAARLATPFDDFCSYYSATGEAEPFERQALNKLRWVAGNEALGLAAEKHRHQFVYSGEPWDFTTARDIRERQKRELVAPNAFNVKISAGGLIDIEYAVQYLQIVHGKSHEELRTPSTQAALEALGRLGLISRTDERECREAYVFLRALSDALRIVRGNAKDLILPKRDTEEYAFLARRLGYLDVDWKSAAEHLHDKIERYRHIAHAFFNNTIQHQDENHGNQ